MFRVFATPVKFDREQIVHEFGTEKAADAAVEVIRESPAFDCIKVEGPGIVRQVERDEHGEWRHTIDRNSERDNAFAA